MSECLDRLTTVAERQERLINQTRSPEGLAALGGERSRASIHDEEARWNDKVNALAGLEFKAKIPIIKDSNKDLDSHLREFQSVLDMHSYGRKGVRAIDRLVVYKRSLEPNGVRAKIYDHEQRVAMRKGRLPQEAQQVFEEIVAKQKRRIRETQMGKEERVDKAFQDLEMSRMTHAEFRGEFEGRIEDFIEAEMLVPDETTLKRKYLTKITSDLREAVLNKLWLLDGEDNPGRKPRTWEEVGDCCEMELQTRGDATARRDAGDNLYLLGPPQSGGGGMGGSSVKCKHCQGDHYTELCASHAAALKVDAQGVSDQQKALAEHARTSKVCTHDGCGGKDHRAHHHRMAAANAFPNGLSKGGGGGSSGSNKQRDNSQGGGGGAPA